MNTNKTINSIEIFDNGNTHSRITVTANNDVRIKIGKDVDPENEDPIIHLLTEAARIIIDNGYNEIGTLRGSLSANKDNSVLVVETNHKNKANRTKFKIDLQLINMVGK